MLVLAALIDVINVRHVTIQSKLGVFPFCFGSQTTSRPWRFAMEIFAVMPELNAK